jgi:acyl-CoA reductase-like NAD-dependent aldehyde dehydrogenase
MSTETKPPKQDSADAIAASAAAELLRSDFTRKPWRSAPVEFRRIVLRELHDALSRLEAELPGVRSRS